MTTITVLSGHGDYADPWHPFDETSQRLAALLAPLGEVTVRVDVEAALAGLTATDARPDLLVFNISRDEGVEPSTPPESAQTGLLAHLADGRPILAVHSASRAFADWPEWSSILGGHWEDGLTFHPERGVAHIVPTDLAGELLGRGRSFYTVDERYTALVLEPDTQPLATHEHGGSEHPLAWFTTFGDAEVVYSALGHDTEAYESPDAAAFVSGAAAWLLREHARSAG
ncbi:ThuA domain-containing protein [Leifsonia flava]|uniref:ThuA domain-containing protein n=1 Tax=Orlajensenia leifsoniae TaxID=2561933 RepID=A0A4Y9R3U7_9MICO|nr:ThuA domain-containing protein [Leifsonia flava]TFV98363.1 ThuA domain-containing protein [Leifsonia flava]